MGCVVGIQKSNELQRWEYPVLMPRWSTGEGVCCTMGYLQHFFQVSWGVLSVSENPISGGKKEVPNTTLSTCIDLS